MTPPMVSVSDRLNPSVPPPTTLIVPLTIDPAVPPTQFPVELSPGSALLFLGSTLHGAGGNHTNEVRRGAIVSYCLGWLKPYENQWLAYPPAVARHFDPDLAALAGYRQHRPNLGNFEGRCPSVLFDGAMPSRLGAAPRAKWNIWSM